MKSIVKWQYEKLEGTIGLLEEHLADPECPCHSDGENCARKHLKRAEDYAQETMILLSRDPKAPAGELNKLDQLATEARAYRQAEERYLCGKRVPEKEFATISWASNWRKYFETLLVSTCQVSARVKDLHPAVAGLEEVKPKIRISGTCNTGKTCQFKVKAVETTEGSTSSIADLDKVIREVQKRASQEGAAVSNRTFAQGTTNVSRYEFDFKIVDADKLVVSHDPFTFVPNPSYPQELQPRLRERAATRLQVERIAANIDPDSLLVDYHSIDRGAPITGPDRIVESGNGRIMALLYAGKNFPGQFERYVLALKEIAPKYNLDPSTADRMKVPVLIRERVSKVNRKQFVEESNASTTIETSSIEKARTDAEKISIEMLQSLEVLEGENIEDALRASRNRAFVQSFLSKLSQNEQARMVDAKGVLNQDGVRRATMALFVATFPGDVGLRLAEKFFESTDINVRNVFNGLARSLGSLAVAEGLTSRGERDLLYTIGDDLAHAIGVFSAIKKTPGMTVEKYLHQSQLFERELTPFQERILVVLDQNSKSSRKIGGILGEYARLVIDSPPPAQASLMPGMDRPTKEELFETAVKKGALADIISAVLGDHPWITQKVDTCGLEPGQIDAIMSWRPLRDFIAWGTGVGNVKICESGMGLDAYQVSIGGLDMQAKSTAAGKVKSIPTARRVYTPYNEVVYEVTIPQAPGEITWAPQEISKEPARPPEGKQAVLFRRVRYNRGDIDSTVQAARKLVEGNPLYVYATYYGFTIGKSPPPGPQFHVIVKPGGETETVRITSIFLDYAPALGEYEPGGRALCLNSLVR